MMKGGQEGAGEGTVGGVPGGGGTGGRAGEGEALTLPTKAPHAPSSPSSTTNTTTNGTTTTEAAILSPDSAIVVTPTTPSTPSAAAAEENISDREKNGEGDSSERTKSEDTSSEEGYEEDDEGDMEVEELSEEEDEVVVSASMQFPLAKSAAPPPHPHPPTITTTTTTTTSQDPMVAGVEGGELGVTVRIDTSALLKEATPSGCESDIEDNDEEDEEEEEEEEEKREDIKQQQKQQLQYPSASPLPSPPTAQSPAPNPAPNPAPPRDSPSITPTTHEPTTQAPAPVQDTPEPAPKATPAPAPAPENLISTPETPNSITPSTLNSTEAAPPQDAPSPAPTAEGGAEGEGGVVHLPDTVTRLDTPEGAAVYLVGTAHFSKESQEDVASTIRTVKPDVVVVELCKARTAILQLDEDTILHESRTLDFKKVQMIMRQHGKIQGVLYLLLLSVSAHITKQLGMAPGGEFRTAFAEARRSAPGCLIQLGDRPIQITLSRALASLSLWHKVKLTWHILTSKEPISKEEVERCKQRDFILEMLAEMTGQFPAISEVFVKERDLYLCRSLQAAAHTPPGMPPRVVVGVVGIGHVPGIVERWGTVTAKDIAPIMRIPPPTLSSRVIKTSAKVSVYALLCYGVYRWLLPRSAQSALTSTLAAASSSAHSALSSVAPSSSTSVTSYFSSLLRK